MAKRKLKGVADATCASLSQVEVVEELQMELMRERAAIEEAMALRALPPPESKKRGASRITSKGGK